MNLSLNEIEGLSKKAARGAGLSWGLAEEAGKAARWLSEHGLNGLALLGEQLRLDDGIAYQELAPLVDKGHWQAASRPMCPLIAGATLSDHVQLLSELGELVLTSVSHPLLLAPFASRMAQCLGRPVHLSWAGCSLFFDAQGGGFVRDEGGLFLGSVAAVSCAVAIAVPDHAEQCGSIPAVDESVLAYFNALAYRTYVPASEASRLQGAGAGLSDND